MSRLTRKDMKRDEVLDWVGRTVQYVRGHGRGLLAIAGAVVAVVAIVAAVTAYSDRQVERANTLLAQALAIHDAPIDAVNPTPDDPKNPSFPDETSRSLRAKSSFETLHEEFKGRSLGAIAAAYLGDLAAATGDAEGAEALWREAMAGVDDTLLAGRLQMNLINLGKSQGRGEAVVEELRGLLSSGSSALPPDAVLYELARALEELGRADEAVGAYERLVDEYESSAYAPDARRKLAESAEPPSVTP